MPRRTYRRKRPTRSRRTYKRRRTFRSKRSRLSTKIYKFKRVATGTQSFTSEVSTTLDYSFSLENLPNYTEFTALFDMYRIDAVKLQLIPKINIADGNTNNRFMIYSVLDYNDIASLSNVDAALQYQNLRKTTSTRTHTRFIKPKVAITQTDVSATSFVSSYKAPWIKTSNADVAHGFIKFISEENPNTNAIEFDEIITMYVSFKNVN